MDRKDVEILEESWAYRGFLQLKCYQLRHKLFNGGWSDVLARELIVRPAVAGVLPYDPVLDKVVLIEQFRPGALDGPQAPWLMEIVAGIAEADESVEALAHREIQEEAGLKALALKLIYRYWVSPGMCNEQITLFCAKVDASDAGGIHGLPDEHEDIKVHVVTTAEAFALVENGQINNAMSLIALQWLQLNKGVLRGEW